MASGLLLHLGPRPAPVCVPVDFGREGWWLECEHPDHWLIRLDDGGWRVGSWEDEEKFLPIPADGLVAFGWVELYEQIEVEFNRKGVPKHEVPDPRARDFAADFECGNGPWWPTFECALSRLRPEHARPAVICCTWLPAQWFRFEQSEGRFLPHAGPPSDSMQARVAGRGYGA